MSDYEKALVRLRAGCTPYPQLCMDFLEGLGYYVGALGNDEIVQLTEEILNEMDLEEVCLSWRCSPPSV